VNRDEALSIFAARWAEATASGCTAVQFPEDKWPLIEMLMEEAKRTQLLRRELIEARAKLHALDLEADEGDNEEDEGEDDPISGHGRSARAA
jgi:hypothetical protein